MTEKTDLMSKYSAKLLEVLDAFADEVDEESLLKVFAQQDSILTVTIAVFFLTRIQQLHITKDKEALATIFEVFLSRFHVSSTRTFKELLDQMEDKK